MVNFLEKASAIEKFMFDRRRLSVEAKEYGIPVWFYYSCRSIDDSIAMVVIWQKI
jgi:hypothetical protein